VTPTAVPAASPTPAPVPTPATPAPSAPPVTGVANGNNAGTKVELQTSYLALIAGLLANYQPNDPFVLASGTMTRDELIASFQSFVTAAETTKSSNATWRQDVQNERAIEATVAPIRADVKNVLVARYGKSGATLTQYGFAPQKAAVRTTLSKTTALAKAEATRKARGTKGSVQKLAVTGNVTGVVITPVTTGPAATPGNAASGTNGAGAPAGTASTTPAHS
jgi:hypothetical protein